jgi:hypothetical protein
MFQEIDQLCFKVSSQLIHRPNKIPFRYTAMIWDNNSVGSDREGNISGWVVDLLIRTEFSVLWVFRVLGNDSAQITLPTAEESSCPSSTLTANPTFTANERLPGWDVTASVIVFIAVAGAAIGDVFYFLTG